jgi:hypothetical protein
LNTALQPAIYDPPLPYLPVEQVMQCRICEDDDIVFTRRSNTTARAHFAQHHKGISFVMQERPVTAQAYSVQQNRRNFIVTAPVGWTPATSLNVDPEFTAADMARAFQNDYQPLVAPPSSGGDDLKRTAPFLFFTGTVSMFKICFPC